MKKQIKRLLAAALVFSVIICSLFVVLNCGHDCTSDGCAICMRIESAFRIIVFITGLCSFSAVSSHVRIDTHVKSEEYRYGSRNIVTPVILRVKLND